MQHYALEYAHHINEVLHRLSTEWYYKHQIYEVPGKITALIITHDKQRDDEFKVHLETKVEEFIKTIDLIKPGRINSILESMPALIQEPERVIMGWENQTIYFIKGGNHPEYWTVDHAHDEIFTLLQGKQGFAHVIMQSEADNVQKTIPVGRDHFRMYEDFVRRALTYLFLGDLGRATPQTRTEPGNEGTEIRDLLCQNRAEAGFWKDLKDKYACSEVLFEAKNTKTLARDNLRQTYCYLKPALGLWGFILCRSEQPSKIHAYNRTLFNNFSQTRGLLILTDDDIRRMIAIKRSKHDPSEYLRNKMSEFIRSV